MKFKEILDWLGEHPIHFRALSGAFCVFCICGTICMFFISSCTEKMEEARFKYRSESSKSFWDNTKRE